MNFNINPSPNTKYISINQLVKKFVLSYVLTIIVIYGISACLSPKEYLSVWQNWFQLLGLVIIGVTAIFAFYVPMKIESEKELFIQEQSRRILFRETENAVNGLKPRLIGLSDFIRRDETIYIWNHIFNKNSILLSGEAGSGKSGIGFELFNKCKENNTFVFVFDVRRYLGINSINQISSIIGLNENIFDVFGRLGTKSKCLIIIDQLDSVCDTALGNLMVEFAIECKKIYQLSVLVISRHNEIEQTLLRNLLESDFEEFQCGKINEELVIDTLQKHGLSTPSPKLIRLCTNILLLDLVCSIIVDKKFTCSDELENETNIWSKYLDLYLERESNDTGFSEGEIYQGLDKMAQMGLKSEDRNFTLEFPLTKIHKRYISQGIISKSPHLNQKYYFKVEKFQDFLYAFSATYRQLLRRDVEKEINVIFQKNIILLMVEFYKLGNPKIYELFLNEVLSG